MRVLFVLKQRNYIRTYAGVVRELVRRGHAVRLAWPDKDVSMPEELEGTPVEVVMAPTGRTDRWGPYTSLSRRAYDYLRYLEPPFQGATKLRARAFEKFARALSGTDHVWPEAWAEIPLALGEGERRMLGGMLSEIEQAMPSDAAIDRFIEDSAPDVVLVSPLIDLGSRQTEVVKSARARSIPTMMLLYSWDNLSTKGGMHLAPDRMLVWNERQREEARLLHNYPAGLVVLTGAPRFDEFFGLQAATTREQFFGPLEFDPARPLLMYVASSPFVSPDEHPFIERWVSEIRHSSDPALQGANILIRPHPDAKAGYEAMTEMVIRWPGIDGKGWVTRPIDDPRVAVVRTSYRSPQAFYEALYHSAAVVGLNTSAEIESAIVGRPVFTIVAGANAADGQDTTLHFHYLLEQNGGFVKLAGSFDEHRSQLAAAIASPPAADRLREFVRTFVRPAGLDVPASTVVADAIEAAVVQEGPAVVLVPPPAAVPEEAPAVESPAAPTAPPPDRARLDFPHTEIWLHVTSDMERKYRARSCAKEPFTVQWIERHIRRSDVVYDIGANVGTFSLIAAKHKGATVVAFEPGYANFARLCENIQLNACEAAIVPLSFPLADASRLVTFRYRTVEPGQSRHTLREEWQFGRAEKHAHYEQPVCTIRLDEAIAQFRLPAPQHLKIDVDGSEGRVLAGAHETLRSKTLRTVLIEVDRTEWESVECTLLAAGLVLAEKYTRDEKKAKAPWYGLFMRP